ncbi:8-oxo-dGTP pyrophosphatase MutT (NUDIX family) [Dyadobacter jejuensis]|uniref:8-oxo-dGTP pyrophosphatase MutT (NUDIX family) n=1 Tax=Dyadobacter jejuensis TaxID=1082580 RepID=A0A316ALT0_9BACT|nr:NUDIX hydrolase [Dyadobacter jejuensis]PWJ58209.1 8-oxo-dGTP pyrophosphatase MutT (NUDIX family) [Dyadobacter jejuensis]
MSSLLALLNNYSPLDPTEDAMYRQTVEFVTSHSNCFERSLSEGHVTASAWVIDPTYGQALMMHHRKLGRWFQPGGHCDGDSDVIGVARKEAEEETGLLNPTLAFPQILDVDVHTIPGNAKDPEHLHYDIRFLFTADPATPLTVNEESRALKWIPLDEVASFNDSESILRLVRKTKVLQNVLLAADGQSVH